MIHQTFSKHAKMCSAIEDILEEICEESECSDFVCRSVTRIADRDFHSTSESTLFQDISFVFMSCSSLIYYQRK